MDVFIPNIGWEKYNIVQYIGGLGMNMNSLQIKKIYNIDHYNFQYPLGVPNSYDYIKEVESDYIMDKKKRKAIFIGAMYGTRIPLTNILSKHNLFEIYDNSKGYYGLEYFKKINEYRVSLSFNGNGEFCLRDLESMGLRIPCLRSKLKTNFYNELLPDYHYINGGKECSNAWFTYSDSKIEDIALQYIDALERIIDDKEKLSNISKNSKDYFNSYCTPNYIIDLFFKLVKIDELYN
jgi:hypothetical protein